MGIIRAKLQILIWFFLLKWLPGQTFSHPVRFYNSLGTLASLWEPSSRWLQNLLWWL